MRLQGAIQEKVTESLRHLYDVDTPCYWGNVQRAPFCLQICTPNDLLGDPSTVLASDVEPVGWTTNKRQSISSTHSPRTGCVSVRRRRSLTDLITLHEVQAQSRGPFKSRWLDSKDPRDLRICLAEAFR